VVVVGSSTGSLLALKWGASPGYPNLRMVIQEGTHDNACGVNHRPKACKWIFMAVPVVAIAGINAGGEISPRKDARGREVFTRIPSQRNGEVCT
jgi:hypothetical protein